MAVVVLIGAGLIGGGCLPGIGFVPGAYGYPVLWPRSLRGGCILLPETGRYQWFRSASRSLQKFPAID